QARLKERYAKVGINVDSMQFHRAVPTKIHEKFITPEQNAWWKKIADTEYDGNLDAAYNGVSLARVEAFEKDLEKDFAKYWVKARASKSTIDKAANAAKSDITKLAAGKADRYKRLGIIGGALGVFSVLSSAAPTLANAK